MKLAARVAAWGISGASLLGLARLAWAGPLDTAVVDKDATWMFHLDVEAGMVSTCGRFATDEMKKDPGAKEITAKFGLDPTKDVKSLTVYGFKPGEDDGLAVLVATAAVDGLAEKVEAEGVKDFQKSVRGDVTHVSWKSEDREWHVAIKPRGEDRVVVFASTAKVLEQGLAIVNGEGSSLKTVDPATVEPMLQKPSKGSILFVAARGLADCEKFKATLFKEARSLVIDVGEDATGAQGAKETFAKISVDTGKQQMATNMQQMVQGWIAMGSMLAGDKDLKGVPECLQGINVAAEGTSLVINARANSEQLLGQLKSLSAVIDSGKDGHTGLLIKQSKSEKEKDGKAPEKKEPAKKDQEK
jgi:hypothetical protein